jgi:hypothetical protein
MDIRFALVASRNPCRTVSASIQLRFRGFEKDGFLLVLSQPIGFQLNVTQIRTHGPRKTMMACPLFENGILEFHRLEIEGGLIILGKKVAHDLLLDDRRIPGKFSCAGMYCVQIHKEQTDKQTFFFVY